MRIDEEKLKKYLKEKLPENVVCPLCHKDNLSASNIVYHIAEGSERGVFAGGGSLIPIISITCHNCGHIMLINTIAAELLERKEQRDE